MWFWLFVFGCGILQAQGLSPAYGNTPDVPRINPAQPYINPNELTVEQYCIRANQPDAGYCPPVEFLRYNPTTLLWGDGKSWEASTQSFITQGLQFIGVEWRGTALGSMVCQYSNPNTNEFSVQLASPKIFYRPDKVVDRVSSSATYLEKIWQEKKADKTVYACYAKDVCACPIPEYKGDTRSIEEIVMSIEKTRDDYSWMSGA